MKALYLILNHSIIVVVHLFQVKLVLSPTLIQALTKNLAHQDNLLFGAAKLLVSYLTIIIFTFLYT